MYIKEHPHKFCSFIKFFQFHSKDQSDCTSGCEYKPPIGGLTTDGFLTPSPVHGRDHSLLSEPGTDHSVLSEEQRAENLQKARNVKQE